ncbi:MAG: PDZ domain-containing protein [Elusimicrobiota bacterium]|jgi:hypothetical protein
MQPIKRLLPLLAASAGIGCSSVTVPVPRLFGPGKPPPEGPQVHAKADGYKARWAMLASGPGVAQGHTIAEGTRLWLRLLPKSLPKGGLESGAPVGLKFQAVTLGVQAQNDRRLIAPGSVLDGEVIEASPLQEQPFKPARLRLYFYRLTDAAEGRGVPVKACVVEAPGWETSSGGVILGHVGIRLGVGEWLAVRLLEEVEVQLEQNVWGIGVTGTQWVGDRLRVTSILPRSSAADAGLSIGDEIVEISGEKLQDYNPWVLMNGNAGDVVTLKVLKNGRGKPVKVRCRHGVEISEGLGLVLRQSAEGPRVAKIAPDSPAERAGIPIGSLIVHASADTCIGLDAPACAKLLHRRAGAPIDVGYRPPGSQEEKRVILRAAKIIKVREP